MGNQNGSGRSVSVPDENRPSWRPQDQNYRSRADEDRYRDDRDDDRYASDRDRDRSERGRYNAGVESRWGGGRESRLGRNWEEDRDEGYRMTERYNQDARGFGGERYGQGQSGYGAGRYGEDRALSSNIQNRNQGGWEGRQQGGGMGLDDRFTGRGGSSYWGDQEQRGFERRGYEERAGRGFEDRAPQSTGYHSGYNRGGMGYGGYGDRGNVGHPGEGQYGQRYYQGGMQGMYVPRGPGMEGQGAYGYREQGPRQGQTGGYMRQPQGMHRGKGPQGYTRSDDRIRELVCDALTDDDMIDATNIGVSVEGGEVTLTGTVEDRESKRRAEDIAEQTPGVKDVQNQIRIPSQTGQTGMSPRGGIDRRQMQGQGNQPGATAVGRPEEPTTDKDKKHRA